MWHKYETRGIVLSRTHVGEAHTLVLLITPGLGLVRARAQGIRRTGAKLAAALATLTESEMVLVRGKEGWRVTGAVPFENWFWRIQGRAARIRAARVSGLLQRLVAGEEYDPTLFPIITGFFDALAVLPEESHDAAEVLAALRILATLGLDTGEIPGEPASFAPASLAVVAENRTAYIARINRGISASGL